MTLVAAVSCACIGVMSSTPALLPQGLTFVKDEQREEEP